MSHLKIVLLKDWNNLGQKGEIVEASPGFYRNFLLKKNIAVLANSPEAKSLIAENMLKSQEISESKKDEESKILSMAGKTVQFKVKVNKKGKPFRAIGPKDIAKVLGIEEERIDTEPIKELGVHQIDIKTPKNNIQIKVDIVPEK